MEQYDLRQPDGYAVHLARHGSESGGVTASQDIVNQQGVLLVKKGHVIKGDAAQKLLNHKLVQPLEVSINIKGAIDGKQLYADLCSMVAKDEELEAVHRAFDLEKLAKRQCLHLNDYPLLAQKITILSTRLPAEYEKSVFCALFGLCLGVQLSLCHEAIHDVFFAGLAHDLGLLHINPDIMDRTGAYTPEEWRAVQSHTLIADVFLSYVEGLSPAVRRAVREHHERCDGSGYPAALNQGDLTELGQVVAMADSVWAISRKLARNGLSLADAITVIKMNKAQHPWRVESALYHLSRCVVNNGRRAKPTISRMDERTRLLRVRQQLSDRFHLLTSLRSTLSADGDRAARSAHVKLERVWFVVTGSGLLAEGIPQWISSMPGVLDEETSHQLYELSLMYSELQWQMFQLERALQQVILHSKSLPAPAKHNVRRVLNSLCGQPMLESAATGLTSEVSVAFAR